MPRSFYLYFGQSADNTGSAHSHLDFRIVFKALEQALKSCATGSRPKDGAAHANVIDGYTQSYPQNSWICGERETS
jgi:hypothetical protein